MCVHMVHIPHIVILPLLTFVRYVCACRTLQCSSTCNLTSADCFEGACVCHLGNLGTSCSTRLLDLPSPNQMIIPMPSSSPPPPLPLPAISSGGGPLGGNSIGSSTNSDSATSSSTSSSILSGDMLWIVIGVAAGGGVIIILTVFAVIYCACGKEVKSQSSEGQRGSTALKPAQVQPQPPMAVYPDPYFGHQQHMPMQQQQQFVPMQVPHYGYVDGQHSYGYQPAQEYGWVSSVPQTTGRMGPEAAATAQSRGPPPRPPTMSQMTTPQVARKG